MRDLTDADQSRFARLIALLAADGSRTSCKLQVHLERLEILCRPIQPVFTIRDARSPRRGIVPTEAEVALIATFASHSSAVVRQRVLNALKHARTHLEVVLPVVRTAFTDDDVLVRIGAAVAVYELGAGARLEPDLLGALESSTWTIRWYAAAALASTPHRERAADVFAASFPQKENSLHHGAKLPSGAWESLAAAFSPPTPAIAARLEALSAQRAARRAQCAMI